MWGLESRSRTSRSRSRLLWQSLGLAVCARSRRLRSSLHHWTAVEITDYWLYAMLIGLNSTSGVVFSSWKRPDDCWYESSQTSAWYSIFWVIKQITKSFQAKLRTLTQKNKSSDFFTNLVIFAEKPVAALVLVSSSGVRISVVYRIRILESNPAGYWEYFGFGLDIVSSSTGSGFSKWNKLWP